MQFVYTVGGGEGYYQPFTTLGSYSKNLELLRDTTEKVKEHVKLVLFTGGSDIDPALYCEPQAKRTSFYLERDLLEVYAFHLARRHGLPMVGICRGAQFLCAMAGGKLIQHVNNHGGMHKIQFNDGKTMNVSSTHHQMQFPPEDAVVLAWADPARSNTYLNGHDEEIRVDRECEIVHYPSINALGIQHHPEMMSPDSEGFKVASELVKKYLKFY